ncbi:hypothetical protein [Roseiconus lacunae]|uniref:hypothetical protein n=1 Tax=Roseiconus lacunae TaxID=2605694 RepID=UPI001E4F3620|nr:hypothetical protein [Roseiconus lacunae]MCD0462694.1 hypothetical protein [Roseiconus lacunae]
MNLRMIRKRTVLAAAIAATVSLPTPLYAQDEFGSNTPFYEDDAWYDITEWFDGNDYNPTDEAIGRWDDEKFQFSDNALSSDRDNDGDQYSSQKPAISNQSPSGESRAREATGLDAHHRYGYREGNEQDWFYDQYDDGYMYWSDRYLTNYYDLNGDGLYDALATYGDNDGDGVYEDFTYLSLNDDGNSNEGRMRAMNKQMTMKSSPLKVNGTVKQTKTVSVRDRDHLVITMERNGEGSIVADLGPKDQFDAVPEEGSDVTVEGLMMKVGEQSLLVAKEATISGKKVQLERTGRSYQGTVEKSMTAKVRGRTHQIAMLKTKADKKLLVDLGPKDRLDGLDDGTEIVVQGIPAKVKDRVVLLARKMVQEGQVTEIGRQF